MYVRLFGIIPFNGGVGFRQEKIGQNGLFTRISIVRAIRLLYIDVHN